MWPKRNSQFSQSLAVFPGKKKKNITTYSFFHFGKILHLKNSIPNVTGLISYPASNIKANKVPGIHQHTIIHNFCKICFVVETQCNVNKVLTIFVFLGEGGKGVIIPVG